MSLEVFEKLEAKVQQAIDTITLLQMEIEELKEKNNSLSQEVQNAQHQREELERENNHLKEQQNGWQASGYDWTTSLSNQTSLPIQYGGKLDELYADKSFSVITAWAVMEHVATLRDTMQNISRMLAPGGIFIALVPNFASIPGRYMQGDDIPRHLNLFTPGSFDRLLREYGLQPVQHLFDQKIFMGTHRGLLVYLLKRLAGEPLDDIVSQHRAPGRRPEFCGMLRGKPSALTRTVCWFDRTVFAPAADWFAQKIGRGFTMTIIARKTA